MVSHEACEAPSNANTTTYEAAAASGRAGGDDDDVNDDELCIICFDARKNVAAVPCGHLLTCTVCEPKFKAGAESDAGRLQCPICRSSVDLLVRVFT